MAKEIIPPDPIPVGEDINCSNDYCASFMDYSKDAYDNTSSELVAYLDKVYGEAECHSSSKIYIASDTTIEDVKEDILSAGITALNEDNLADYISLWDYDNNLDPNIEVDDNEVIICLLFY